MSRDPETRSPSVLPVMPRVICSKLPGAPSVPLAYRDGWAWCLGCGERLWRTDPPAPPR